MKTFQELQRNCKKELSALPLVKLTVMGDCATQLLSMALRGYGAEVGLNLLVTDIDYNQMEQQVMDPGSELYESEPQFVLIQMCVEKLYEQFCQMPVAGRASFAQNTVDRIVTIWDGIGEHSGARILQFNFVELGDRVFGNFGYKEKASFVYQLRQLNMQLMLAASEKKNVYLVGLSEIQNQMGRGCFFDEKYYYSAKTPISMQALPHVAKQVADVIMVLRGKIKKCVVLDLDNTLWGGVIGDDGMSGIQIGELGMGHAFSDFQLWLRELKNRGIILTVCSKNNENIAKEPFEKHPEMVLRMEDISLFVANWEDKVSNIRYIQETLNIGMDSMVFLDDNPFERNMVRSMIPEITVPELPEDPAQYLSYVQSLNLFETASFSEEDKNRTGQYQAEIQRTQLQRQFVSLDDYLIGLDMKAKVCPFDAFHYPRIAQLTQRSNQFNLRTVRYTEDDIQRMAEDDHYITLYFTLRDKFGDHGLISVVILEKRDKDTLFVDTWLMSCRVLKRGMEEFIINQMIKNAGEHGFKTVLGEYIKTPKNAMVADIYERLGFNRINDAEFVAQTVGFKLNQTYIAMEE